jgi:hypothetical protein
LPVGIHDHPFGLGSGRLPESRLFHCRHGDSSLPLLSCGRPIRSPIARPHTGDIPGCAVRFRALSQAIGGAVIARKRLLAVTANPSEPEWFRPAG